MSENRFHAIETDGETDISTNNKSKVTIEQVVEFMVENKTASIHIDVPVVRASDGYKEVKYRMVAFKS